MKKEPVYCGPLLYAYEVSMTASSKKLGFWPVFALVTGSQISSGVFILPTTLAPFGWYTFIGWALSGCGAVALAYIFGQLCQRYPETGGPHVYAQKAFGNTAAFFVGWTYWLISWVSTTVVFAACVGYLRPVFGIESALSYFLLQLALLIAVTALNLKNAHLVGRAEFFLTILKFIPLILLPALVLPSYSALNLIVAPAINTLPLQSILSKIVLFTFWGFIGLESATAPAGIVHNPGRTIPLALVAGTTCVALLYMFNSIGIMGAVSGSLLAHSNAPYVDAAQAVFGGSWHIAIAIISSIVCLSTLNAWTLTSGQIAFGLGKAGLFPSFFCRETAGGAPFWGLIVSGLGITPLLALLSSKSLHEQVATIIDLSVVSFLFIYLACCIAFLWLIKHETHKTLLNRSIALIAAAFCIWIIANASYTTLAVSTLFTLSGLPFFYLWRR